MNKVFMFALLFLASCVREPAEDLSPERKAQIMHEVKAATDSMISRWAALDAEGALQYYSDSPEWAWFGPGGTRVDFQAFKKLWTEVNQSTASLNVITVREEFTVVASNAVICAWEGRDQSIMNSGDTLTYDPHAITFVFKKISDQWKVTYTHESGIPAVHKSDGHLGQ